MKKSSRTTSQPSSETQYKTFHLRSPHDLLGKLAWDIGQLQQIPSHTAEYHYQAMNCAVTAWQMCDWVYFALGKSIKDSQFAYREHIRAKSRWLTMCRDIADASKHRHLTFNPEPEIGTPVVDVFRSSSGKLFAQMLIYDGTTAYSVEQVMSGAYEFWHQYLGELRL